MTRRPLASVISSIVVGGSRNVSATRCFLCRKQRRALPDERNGKALLWGEVDCLWRRNQRRAVLGGSLNCLVGYHPAKFCAESFDLRQLLSDAFEQGRLCFNSFFNQEARG